MLGRHMYDAIVPWWSAVASGDLPDDAGDLGPASRDGGDPQLLGPMVLSSGKRVFDEVRVDLPLRLVTAEVFEGGAVVLRYEP